MWVPDNRVQTNYRKFDAQQKNSMISGGWVRFGCGSHPYRTSYRTPYEVRYGCESHPRRTPNRTPVLSNHMSFYYLRFIDISISVVIIDRLPARIAIRRGRALRSPWASSRRRLPRPERWLWRWPCLPDDCPWALALVLADRGLDRNLM